jgi:ribonuclease P protein component
MLSKEKRILKKGEFDAFFGYAFKRKYGKSMAGSFFVVKAMKNKYKSSRFGFIVNNKIDNRSTARNKIKRRLREIARLNFAKLKESIDILIVVKPSAKGKSLVELEREFSYILDKLGIFKTKEHLSKET